MCKNELKKKKNSCLTQKKTRRGEEIKSTWANRKKKQIAEAGYLNSTIQDKRLSMHACTYKL